MDIKILKSFITVAKHKSFSRAANELNTVQPAVSRHITALEAELGVSLFNRNSRDVVITQAGEQLLKDAKAILTLTEQAKTKVKRAQNGHLGNINIAYLSSACLAFLSDLVSTYKTRFPHVHVRLFEMTVTEQIEAFKNESIDVAFSRPLPNNIASDYVSHNIYMDKLVAVVHQDHSLSSKKTIKLEALKSEPFILFNRDEAQGLFDETITHCKQVGFSPNIVSQPRHMQTLVTEVAANLGVSIAPFCVRKLYSRGCQFIELSNISTEIPVQIQYKNCQNNATVEEFIAIALEARGGIQKVMNM